MILTYEAEEELEMQSRREQYWAEWRAYGQALSKADVVVRLNVLQPKPAGETPHPGAPHVRIGAEADPRAPLEGAFVLDVADLDEALEWAARCPAAANGTVEVRPLLLSDQV
jgi:hypothetical protein